MRSSWDGWATVAAVRLKRVCLRSGLGVAARRPLYVLAVRPGSRTVVVGAEEDLDRPGHVAREMSWISGEPPARAVRAGVKIRHRSAEAPATVEPLPDCRARVLFDDPQRAVTPGQAAVFYDGEMCLGGGWIQEAL